MHPWGKRRGVFHTIILPFTFFLKYYLKTKRRIYGNSNISACKNIICSKKEKNSSKRNQNLSGHY
jgi:hypothetical protein